MNRHFLAVTLPICATVIVAVGYFAIAGDLNPPVGPVAPTHKTLTEVEPRIAINATNTPGDADSLFRITASGSYYLTGNVTGVAAKHGIEIATSDVSIDLIGHTLRGLPGSLTGIRTDGAFNNLAVRNGTVTAWGGDGIDLSEGAAGGQGSLIESVISSSNTIVGLTCNIGGVIRGCTVYGSGVHGISAANNGLIESCSVRNCGSHGIIGTSGCMVRGCVVRDNSLDGIIVSLGCTVIDCTSTDNSRHGVTVVGSSTVERCTCSFNSQNGIEVDGDCLVRGNTCATNGNFGSGAGIHVTSGDNRIEDNAVTDNDRGIDVDGADNLIIRNSASGNTTNFDIVVNNKVGVIVAAPNSAAISGSTGGAGVGTTNPWANISF